jgi:hypothetical protein
MEAFPPVPDVDDAPGMLDDGHLWIVEYVDGGPLRFRLRDDGRIDFGDHERVFGDVPPEYAATLRHVRERLDRTALRSAVEDVERVTFLGVATYRRRVDYDFYRTPPFVGLEVHDGETYLPPDAAENAFERLRLDPVPALDKEVRAVDFDPNRYAVPDSTYYDGPAFGAVLRNKTGDRARIPNPAFDPEPGPVDGRGSIPDDVADPATASAEELAAELVTDDRVRAVLRDLRESGADVTFDAVFERVIERIDRKLAHRLTVHGADVDRRVLRGAIAPEVRRRFGHV